MAQKKRLFNTKVIHSGHKEDKETGAVMPPIHLSSTFKQKSPGDFKYEYARTNNPTREILEKLLAEIEEGNQAFAFSSGMAAINCLTDALDKDFHIICSPWGVVTPLIPSNSGRAGPDGSTQIATAYPIAVKDPNRRLFPRGGSRSTKYFGG